MPKFTELRSASTMGSGNLPMITQFIIGRKHREIRKLAYLTQLISSVQFIHSVVSNSATLWIAACQASLSITNSQSLLKLMSIESVMPSSHLILCYHLLLLPSILPSIRVFNKESVFRIRWPKY